MATNFTFRATPQPTIKRIPAYLAILKELELAGQITVSTTDIADRLALNPIQVRKDLSITGITGRPKIGYITTELIAGIYNFLGWHNTKDAVLVGAGALGSALLGYKGFAGYGLRITATFDSSKKLIGKTIHGRVVAPINELEDFIRQSAIRIGIITVPAEAAQDIAYQCVRAGIRGIWNFSPVKLAVPHQVVVQNEDLSSGLALLSVKISEKLSADSR